MDCRWGCGSRQPYFFQPESVHPSSIALRREAFRNPRKPVKCSLRHTPRPADRRTTNAHCGGVYLYTPSTFHPSTPPPPAFFPHPSETPQYPPQTDIPLFPVPLHRIPNHHPNLTWRFSTASTNYTTLPRHPRKHSVIPTVASCCRFGTRSGAPPVFAVAVA
jgi:hypothetical protein